MVTDLQVVSLFAGIEGFGLGCDQAGMTVVVAVEIDPVCRSVIRRHFPDCIILDDIREVTGEQLRAFGVDPARCVLTFGWPCQDLSIAGRRAGLGGARSGLFWEAMRILGELGPRWFIAENVPGLLSAVCTCPGDQTCLRAGRPVLACGRWDTKRILGIKRRVFTPHVMHPVPDGACPGGCMARHGGAMGTVVGAMGQRGYGHAYRVLDAQYTGVPQRRRRVFFVGCLGVWGASAQVLFDADRSPRRDQAGGAAGAVVAGTLGSRVGGSRSTDLDGHGAYVAHTLTSGRSASDGVNDPGRRAEDDFNLVASNAPVDLRNMAETGDIAGSLQAHHRSYSVSAMPHVVSTVQGGGKRGHRVDAESAAGGHLIAFDRAQITHGENRVNPQPGDASEDGTGRRTPIIAHPVTSSMGRLDGTVETMVPVDEADQDDPGFVVVGFNSQHRTVAAPDGLADPVTASNGQAGNVATTTMIRRLTPLECERLQGFPDGWTEFDDKGNPLSDAARYRMIGNAVPVTCSRWIAMRIVAREAGEL